MEASCGGLEYCSGPSCSNYNRGYDHPFYFVGQAGGSGFSRYTLDRITMLGLASVGAGVCAGIRTGCKCLRAGSVRVAVDGSGLLPDARSKLRMPDGPAEQKMGGNAAADE